MINSVVLVHERTVPTEQLPPTYADRGCRVVIVADPCGHILVFLDRSHYFFEVGPELYSQG
jgi:hypothetical protein